MKYVVICLLPFFMLSCAGGKSSQGNWDEYHRTMADSLLAYAFDHEALYSLLDTIKPVSSVKFLSFPLAKDSTQGPLDHRIVTNLAWLDSVESYRNICRKLSNRKVQFVLVPFQQSYKGMRNMEIYAVNRLKFRNMIRQYASFFGQFGITPDTDPVQVITIIECENKYDRWRGYGYLFGYPNYAVDFFVTAGKQQDSTSLFVKRKFFQIPVFAAEQGHFTYAMPENHIPDAVDSVLYQNSMRLLSRYKELRNKYVSNRGFQAVRLWRNL